MVEQMTGSVVVARLLTALLAARVTVVQSTVVGTVKTVGTAGAVVEAIVHTVMQAIVMTAGFVGDQTVIERAS